MPVAARARLGNDGRLRVKGRVLAPDGSKRVDVEADEEVVPGAPGREAARACGLRLAAEALSQGAAELLCDPSG